MNSFVFLRLYKTFEKVNYYTFLIDGQEITQAEKFFENYINNDILAENLNELVEWIQLIGEKHGAKSRYFRFENSAEALPPSFIENNNLRLYVVRVSENIVILANGGIKTHQAVQDCPDLLPHFRFANKMAKQINNLINSGELKTNGKEIINIKNIELEY